ncbi:Sugar kinase of the NBD/HSP70 family, may contain an N-terminal HTH domain [Salinibacillus kushneri]|uniref:Sugar kinase of the NBD/HSP70 family, may contain an N-terminal HTH domain n=1 Tax=Salinibacillus kushneri TaxID=237682 RepID=A0A1I0EQN8_9BACI|nr:ROK family transcriptional regulator [Salinibacillus kushneri]SET46914.1 Sugar kinase of the NBD/HSP70 family, may contain an N-terminal HTH domain [Salinibacillus kushneri]
MQKLKTGDQNLVKQMNKSIVFHTIQKKGPISRAQISKLTGLNKATVSTMVSEMIDESFVYEIEATQSSGGRKPVMLYFNNHAGYSIGIDLGVNYILGLLTDLNGNIIEEVSQDLTTIQYGDVKQQLYAVIQTLINKAPDSPYGVIGIGIGVPGNINHEETIILAPNLKWEHKDLKTEVQNEFYIPVKIQNEANSGAIGEHIYGAGRNISNLIYVSIGIGIGTGIIIQGNLYTGTSGISGEMGHFTIDANGRKCRCGNNGCWELYASENALLEHAKKQKVLEETNAITLKQLSTEAQMGNKKVLQVLHTLGENIGIGLTNIINTFNPQMIIIGNRLSQFSSWISNPIHNVLDERLSYYHKENTDINFSILGKHSIALGAASISISHFFKENKLENE